MESYDAVIIGTGQGGTPLAKALATAGKRTAIIERAEVGGTCVNHGCTPTKTMVASARVAHLVRRAADYGVETGPIRVRMETVRKRKRDIVASWSEGSENGIIKTEGLTLLRGDAFFLSPTTLAVRDASGVVTEIGASTTVISTGTRTRTPQIEGLSSVEALDHRSVMELGEVPDHLIVIGGGYIGLEFGQMFRRFGSNVTIIHRHSHLLRQEDDEISESIAAILREDGIRLCLESTPLKVAPQAGGLEVTVETPIGSESIQGTHLLLAVGRVPNSDTLQLDAAGVKTDELGYVQVNTSLETSAPGIYAIGDVKGGPAFTHIAYDDYRVLKENLLHGGRATTHNRMLPYTVFIDPQLGRIGMTEEQARAERRAIHVAKLPMSSVARAMEMDETRGLMKAVVDADSGQILGASILGVEGGEVATVLQMAMMGGVPYQRIRDGVFSHPTLSESLNNLFMQLE